MQMFARNNRLTSVTTAKRDIVIVMVMSLKAQESAEPQFEMQWESYRCIKAMHLQDQLHLGCVRWQGFITRRVDQHDMYSGAVARFQAKST